MLERPSSETEMIIDYSMYFLKDYYQYQLKRTEEKLAQFDNTNWSAWKQNLLRQIQEEPNHQLFYETDQSVIHFLIAQLEKTLEQKE
jgi:hypothetical protein